MDSATALLVQTSLTPLAFTIVLATVLGAAYRTYRQKYLAYWAGYWGTYAIGWPAYAWLQWSIGTHSRATAIAGVLSNVCSYAARILFLLGTAIYMEWRRPGRRTLRGIAAAALVLSVVEELMRAAAAAGRVPEWAVLPFRSFGIGGLAMLVAGTLVLRGANTLPRRILGVAILLFGLSDVWDFAAELFVGDAWTESPAGLRLSVFISQLTDAISGAGMLVAAIGTERERAERAVVELREREEQLGHARKLEAAGQLAGSLAHDFNNLLTVIVGSLQFVGERLPEGDPGHLDVDAARQAADRGARLTRQLLTFARRQPVQPRVINLAATVSALDRMLAALAGERIARRLVLAPDLWNVLVDPAQIEQVLVNLVVNARDAMPSGGTLTVEAHNVSAGGLDSVVLAVEDSGVGMDEPTQQRMFEPFFTTKANGKGTGLGLSTVYGIVQQARGRIEVRSAPGRGSRFEIWLPRCDRPLEDKSSPPAASPRGSERILLVENEPEVRSAAARALQNRGYDVVEAEGGDAALNVPLDGIALAVLDVVMPGMDGWQLGRELRRRRPDQRLLFISGYVPSLEDAGELRSALFLPKPFTPEQLVTRVREALDG